MADYFISLDTFPWEGNVTIALINSLYLYTYIPWCNTYYTWLVFDMQDVNTV